MKSFFNIPAISIWEAVSKQNKLLLLLNWAVEPMSLDDIRDAIYPGGGSEKRRRVMVLLSELKKKGLVEAPERGRWIGMGKDPAPTGAA